MSPGYNYDKEKRQSDRFRETCEEQGEHASQPRCATRRTYVWSSKKPDRAGWWWFHDGISEFAPIIVLIVHMEVYDDLRIWKDDQPWQDSCEPWDGVWAGPIEPPIDPQDENGSHIMLNPPGKNGSDLACKPSGGHTDGVASRLTQYGLQRLREGKAVGFGSSGCSHELRIEGTDIIVATPEASMRLPQVIVDAIVAFKLHEADSDSPRIVPQPGP